MKRLKGYFFIAAAAILWGLSATVVKHLFNVHVDPLIIIQTRVSIAFVLLIVYFGLMRRSLLAVAVKDLPRFLYVGICGVAGSNYFYYVAIKEANVSTAILVQYTAPIMVALYATIVQRKAMTRFTVGALALSTIGIVLAVGKLDGGLVVQHPKGITLAIFAAVSFAIFNIAGKPLMQRYHVWTVLIYVLGAATLFWLFVNPPGTILAARYTEKEWLVFASVSLMSILFPYAFYFAGLRYLEATKAIITSTLEPVVAIISEVMFLRQPLAALQVLGAVSVIGAIALLRLGRRPEQA